MSVIHYAPDELAMVASVAVGNMSSSDGKAHLLRCINTLVQYSAENAAAYTASYGEEAQAWSYDDIRAAVRIASTCDQMKGAIRTFGGLRYNLVANNGRDFATKDTLDGLLSMALSIGRRTIGNHLRAA